MTNTLTKITAVLTGAIIAFASVAVLTTGQADAFSWRSRNAGPNIAQVAVENGNFTTLVSALQCTGLDRVVSSRFVRLTVFAPTDAAFEKLGLNADNVCDTFKRGELANILLYHVDWGVKDADKVLSRNSLRMLNFQKAKIDPSVPSIANAELNVDLLNIRASNGIIHVVNDVLLP